MASSSLATGVVWGALITNSVFSVTSRSMSIRAWTNASMVYLVSDSVGSIINASWTISGKYMVGAWKP